MNQKTKRLFVLTTVFALLVVLWAGSARVLASGHCDATVSSGSSIQAAIDAASAGQTICVEAGTYQENLAAWKDMEITKSLSLVGAGSGQTIVELSEGKQNGVEIRGSNLSVTIQGITFTKQSAADSASNFGLRIAETSSSFTNLTLRDVEVFYAKGRNVFLGAAGAYDNVVIEDSKFNNAGAWGFSAAGQINSMTVSNSDFEYNGWDDPSHGIGFDLTGPGPYTKITVSLGSFSNNTKKGINLTNVTSATFTGVTANDNEQGVVLYEWHGASSNVSFIDCVAHGNSQDGVFIGRQDAFTIDDLTIEGCDLQNNNRDGIFVWPANAGAIAIESTNFQIRNNHLQNNGVSGLRIQFPVTNSAITGNTVIGSAMNGIAIFRASDTVIEGNESINNGANGVALLFSQSVAIGGNMVSGNNASGIVTVDVDDVAISGNNIENNTGNVPNPGGLTLREDTRNLTASGNIISGNTVGIWMSGAAGTSNAAYSNRIEGNTTAGVENLHASNVLDASANFWNTTDAAVVEGMITGLVDFTPLLHSGTDLVLGFDPNLTELTVHTLGEQIGPLGRIQEGVNLVDGSTVNVAAGIYPEGPQVVIDHDVTIVGADRDTTIVTPTANTGSSGDARGWFLVNPDVEVSVSELTFDGAGFNIYQAWRTHGTGTFETLAFKNMRFSTYLGWGIAALGGAGPVDVLDSTFESIGRIGVQYFGTGTSGTFDGNTYTGKGDGNHLDYGVEVGAGAGPIVISNNSITDNRGKADTDGSNSAAILVTTFFGPGSSATIHGNTLSNNTLAIAVGYDEHDTSDVMANFNNIADNGTGIRTTNPPVDGTCNWWGEANGPAGAGSGSGDPVSENVTFAPWLIDEAPSGACTGGLDAEGPITSNVVADPIPAPIDTAVLLTATVDDATTGGSNIASADYSLDGGSTWSLMSMDASDGDFDEVMEDIEATIGPFATPQVLDVCVRGTDAAGNTGDPECILLAVYDPDGGFVTGGGWIWSPIGAYEDDPALEGRATFGFVSKYSKGKNAPDGNTQFVFKAADLNFHSSSYEWLVVNQNATNAQFKGFGTVNGGNAPNGGPFRFMLWAGDGTGSNGEDTFRIKIWWENNGEEFVVYDNGMDQPIGGGNIVVHSGKKK